MTQESTPTLEPCPFCGGEAAFDGIEMQVQCKTSACTGQSWMFDTKGEAIAAWNRRTPPASQSEALVTQADREAVKRHQQRFLAEGTSETKLLLEAFASHRLAALRAVWTPVDVVGLGARMATLADSNALPTTIQLIVDMYDALERLSHERASARAEGRREGIEEADNAVRPLITKKGPAGILAIQEALSAIRALAEKQP